MKNQKILGRGHHKPFVYIWEDSDALKMKVSRNPHHHLSEDLWDRGEAEGEGLVLVVSISDSEAKIFAMSRPD